MQPSATPIPFTANAETLKTFVPPVTTCKIFSLN